MKNEIRQVSQGIRTSRTSITVAAWSAIGVVFVGLVLAGTAVAAVNMDDTISYDFVDISGTGTSVSLGDDDMSSAIDMEFNFNWFGTPYSDIYIYSNGFLSFSGGQPSYDYGPDGAYPNTDDARDAIFG
ncbi:MAG TPA: hypothetical protein ENN80_10205 [Candidatus Hydrogenedentes bacterium]|nr:hypothetical protein [Candidatus Hydrogenedentota bacterium]